MADIALAAPSEGADQRDGASATWNWLTNSRVGRLACSIAAAAASLSAVLLAHVYWRPFLDSFEARAYFLSASIILWLPLSLLCMDVRDNLGSGPRLLMPILTTIVLAGVTAIALSPWGHRALFPDGQQLSGGSIATLFAFLALALIPRVINGWQFADAKEKEIDARKTLRLTDEPTGETTATLDASRLQNADMEAVGALVATLAVIAIIILAYEAGRWSDKGGLANNVGIFIAVATISVFGIFVLAERLPDFPPVRAFRRSIRGASSYFGWLATVYNKVDWVFVRLLAHAAGMEHRDTRARYGVLITTEFLLCLLAWYLPPPLGLVPAAIAFFLAFSVSRLWSWVEDDRALAIITRFSPKAPIKVGFREDYRDETLLAFMFALTLIPIALMQMHAGRVFGVPLFDNAPTKGVGGWIGYLGFELAKALPIVDWADIYGLSEGADVMRPTRPIGMHTVFAARAMVDLVLISALLQAISISVRNRQQKQLYAYQQIRRVDEIIERRELARVLSRPEAERYADDVIDFRHYDRARLSELFNTTQDTHLKAFIQKIFDESSETLESAMLVLARLAEHRAPLAQLEEALVAVTKQAETASPQDLTEVMENLRGVEGLKTFKENLVDFAAHLKPVDEVVTFLELIMFGRGADRFQYTRLHAAKVLRDLSPKILNAEQIREILSQLDVEQSKAFGARAFVPNALREALQLRLRELRA